MKLMICRTDSLFVPERIPVTCGNSDVSRQARKLFHRFSCSLPPDPKMDDNYSR